MKEQLGLNKQQNSAKEEIPTSICSRPCLIPPTSSLSADSVFDLTTGWLDKLSAAPRLQNIDSYFSCKQIPFCRQNPLIGSRYCR